MLSILFLHVYFLFSEIKNEEREKIAINQKQEKHTMITKNSLLRPNRTSSLIMNSKPKTVRPTKADSNEPDIDFNNIPTIKGTYKATKVNLTTSTKGTSESISDIKDTTTKTFSHEQTTRPNKTSNFAKSPIEIPSDISVTKSMTVKLKGEEKLKQENVVKTSLTITTTQSNLDIFKDFRNPDLETSPWKPIVPVYVNTEFKLLPDGDKKKETESSTQKIVSLNDTNLEQLENKTSTAPSIILGLLDSINFHDISTIDTDITGFPRDRIVPDSTVSEPDIEVAGQLPSETYDVKLKLSSEYDGNNKTSGSESLITHDVTEKSISIKDNILFREKHTDSNSTRKTVEKFDDLLSTIRPDDIEPYDSEKNSDESPTHGIGVAEPVSDTEIELEAKNRESSILALSENEKYSLRDVKVNVNSQQPVYASYNTPDLNGGSFGASLVENLATKNPFRHTIPVDKITSAVNHNDNSSLHYSDDLSLSSDEIDSESNVSQEKIMTSPDSEEIIEKTLVTEHDTVIQLPNYEQITSTEPDIMSNDEPLDDELSHLNTTENYSDPIKKFITDSSGDKKSVSRNSTFIEIDIVKHTPGQSKRNSESYVEETVADNDEPKKIYNDTLKAFVVKNFVTPAPANNKTEINKSVQLRPKIDSIAEETTSFGTNNYTHERDTMNMESASKQFSSHEIQPDPVNFNEKESSRHNSTIIEQIVEVVTSISTRVSSNIKSNPVVISKIIRENSTNPIIRSEKITTEKVPSSIQERPSLSSKNMRTMQTSDRKMWTFGENQSLLEKLKQLAEIRTDDDFVQVKRRNNSNSNVTYVQYKHSNASPLNIDELKKIANVMTENKTLKNANLAFTLSRDGVEIFTKVLHKVKDQTDETLTNTRFQQGSFK